MWAGLLVIVTSAHCCERFLTVHIKCKYQNILNKVIFLIYDNNKLTRLLYVSSFPLKIPVPESTFIKIVIRIRLILFTDQLVFEMFVLDLLFVFLSISSDHSYRVITVRIR